MCKADKTELEM